MTGGLEAKAKCEFAVGRGIKVAVGGVAIPKCEVKSMTITMMKNIMWLLRGLWPSVVLLAPVVDEIHYSTVKSEIQDSFVNTSYGYVL